MKCRRCLFTRRGGKRRDDEGGTFPMLEGSRARCFTFVACANKKLSGYPTE